MKDAAVFAVKINAGFLCKSCHMLPRGNRQFRGLYSIVLIIAEVRGEFQHPAIFMPAWFGVEQQWRIRRKHPFHALQHCADICPDLSIAGGKLPAICKRCFHGRIAVAVINRDVISFFTQNPRGCRASDTTANNCEMFHNNSHNRH